MMNRIKKAPLSEHPSVFLGKGYFGLTILTRGILFSLIWWALTNGDLSSWVMGGPAVVLALIVSMLLIPPTSLVWSAGVKFVLFFMIRSLMGGIDVAWRAFHPRLPIEPDLIEYPLQLPPGVAQVVMVNTVSLLPGTLSAELNDSVLKVHVLDGRSDVKSELMVVEKHVRRLFGLEGS
ncbi:MAG: Na+/H+ antiporter subunit E [Thiomicrorhabdus sp.]|nr:Na+/H+ antiporter subunit E [Thiomicrorhabdus sp.]